MNGFVVCIMDENVIEQRAEEYGKEIRPVEQYEKGPESPLLFLRCKVFNCSKIERGVELPFCSNIEKAFLN